MRNNPIANTIYKTIYFLPILFLSIVPIIFTLLFFVLFEAGKSTAFSSIALILVIFIFLPFSLRQLIYLFPYKFGQKKNYFLLTLLSLFLVLSATLAHKVLSDIFMWLLFPCPKGYLEKWLTFGTSESGLNILLYFSIVSLMVLCGSLCYRFYYKETLVSELDVLYLRAFSTSSDYYPLRLISKSLKNKANLGFVLPPKSMLSAWDPYLIAFSGSFILPFSNLPILFKESTENWKEDLEILMKNARCIIVDTTIIRDGTEWEINTLKKLQFEHKTIVLANEKEDKNTKALKAAKNIITYNDHLSVSSKETIHKREELAKAIDDIFEEQGMKKIQDERQYSKQRFFLNFLVSSIVLLSTFTYLYSYLYPSNLEQAIYFDDIQMVEKYTLEEGAEKAGICSLPPLVRALENRKYSLARLMLENNANPDILYSKSKELFSGNENPLTWAVNNQDIVAVELLLKHGANPHKYLTSSLLGAYTPIGIAKDTNYIEILELFSELSLHDKDISYWPPLVQALEQNRYQEAERLLVEGSSPDVKYSFSNLNPEESPLQWAIKQNDIEAMKLLFKYSANPDLELSDNTLLFSESSTLLVIAVREGNVAVVQLLLNNGADPDMKLSRLAQDDYTAIDVAEDRDINEKILQMLYIQSAIVNNTSYSYHLRSALEHNKYQVAESLLEDGIDPNTSVNDLSLLIMAVRNNDIKAVKLLLRYGADPDKVFSSFFCCETAISVAEKTKNSEMLNLLYKQSANNNNEPYSTYLILSAIENNRYQDLELLLKEGANPNISFNNSFPLIFAIKKRDIKAITILLKKGANPDTGSVSSGLLSWSRDSSLILAVKNHDSEVVKLLLEHGANPNKQITSGILSSRSAVEIAKKANMKEILALLLNE
jgi:ankyrin repeat protein